MAEKLKNSDIVNAVWGIAAPLAQELGLILWDVKFEKEGVNRYLRIIIDKESGVSLDDCVAMNDALDAPLDEADIIDCSYNLQISSPGIERELVRDFHFTSYTGADVIVKFHAAVNGTKTHHCILGGYSEGRLRLIFDNGEEAVFDKKDTVYIKLDDFDNNF